MAFALEGKREKAEITPATISFGQVVRFNQAVEIGTRASADVPAIGQWVEERSKTVFIGFR